MFYGIAQRFEDEDDEDTQLALLSELTTTLTMASGHVNVAPAMPPLVTALASQNPEVNLLGLRGLNTALDIDPRAAREMLVRAGALPLLCGKLERIFDIDVAEQCLKCLHEVAGGGAVAVRGCLEAGGLKSVLGFLDFFSRETQHTALATAARLCAHVGLNKEDVKRALEVLPLLCTQLANAHDAQVAQLASNCFEHLVSSFEKPAVTDSSDGPPPWRAAFLREIAGCGVVQHWLKLLRKGVERTQRGRVLKSLAALLGASPSMLITLHEEGATELLKQFFLEPLNAGQEVGAVEVGRPGSDLVQALQLAKAMLPALPHKQPLTDTTRLGLKAERRVRKRAISTPRDSLTQTQQGSPPRKRPDKGKGKAKAKARAQPNFEDTPTQLDGHATQQQNKISPAASKDVLCSPSSQKVGGPWSCSMCTFLNNTAHLLACEMCGTPNADASPVLKASPALAAALGDHAVPLFQLNPLSTNLSQTSAPPSVATETEDLDKKTTGQVGEETATLEEIYRQHPGYFDLFVQDLLCPILKNVTICSVGEESDFSDGLVLSLLKFIQHHSVESLKSKDVGNEVCLGLLRLLRKWEIRTLHSASVGGRIAGQSDIPANIRDQIGLRLLRSSISFAIILMQRLPEPYHDLFLRHGITAQICDIAWIGKETDDRLDQKRKLRLTEERAQRGFCPDKLSTNKNSAHGSPKRIAGPMRKLSHLELFQLAEQFVKRFDSTASASSRADPSVKRRRKAPPPSSREGETLMLLKTIVTSLLQPASLDDAGDELKATFQALADHLLSSEGVTGFELREARVVPALLEALWSAMLKNQSTTLKAFANVFFRDQASALFMLVAQLQQCVALTALQLPMVRHGGTSLVQQLKCCVRPFTVKIVAKSNLSRNLSLSGLPSRLMVEPLVTLSQLKKFLERRVKVQRVLSSHSKKMEPKQKMKDGVFPTKSPNSRISSSSNADRKRKVAALGGATKLAPTSELPKVPLAKGKGKGEASMPMSAGSLPDKRKAAWAAASSLLAEVSSRKDDGPLSPPCILRSESLTELGVTSDPFESLDLLEKMEEAYREEDKNKGSKNQRHNDLWGSLLASDNSLLTSEPKPKASSASAAVRFKKGSEVFSSFFGVWYKGTVTKVHGNGKLDVLYEDGDLRRNISPDKLLEKLPPEATASYNRLNEGGRPLSSFWSSVTNDNQEEESRSGRPLWFSNAMGLGALVLKAHVPGLVDDEDQPNEISVQMQLRSKTSSESPQDQTKEIGTKKTGRASLSNKSSENSRSKGGESRQSRTRSKSSSKSKSSFTSNPPAPTRSTRRTRSMDKKVSSQERASYSAPMHTSQKKTGDSFSELPSQKNFSPGFRYRLKMGSQTAISLKQNHKSFAETIQEYHQTQSKTVISQPGELSLGLHHWSPGYIIEIDARYEGSLKEAPVNSKDALSKAEDLKCSKSQSGEVSGPSEEYPDVLQSELGELGVFLTKAHKLLKSRRAGGSCLAGAVAPYLLLLELISMMVNEEWPVVRPLLEADAVLSNSQRAHLQRLCQAEMLSHQIQQQVVDPLGCCAQFHPPWIREVMFNHTRVLSPGCRLGNHGYFRLCGVGQAKAVEGMLSKAQQVLDHLSNGSRGPNNGSTNNNGIGNLLGQHLGTSQRMKVTVSRDHCLESAEALFSALFDKEGQFITQNENPDEDSEAEADSDDDSGAEGSDGVGRRSRLQSESSNDTGAEALLTFEFERETGHGKGPTLEFYSTVCKELQKQKRLLWRGDNLKEGEFVRTPGGLFPSIISSTASSKCREILLQHFAFVGRFIGKALQDNRALDLPLALPLCKAICGARLCFKDLGHLDQQIAQSVKQLLDIHRQYQKSVASSNKRNISKLQQQVDDLNLYFTLPGHEEYDLKPSGRATAVTAQNLGEYCHLVMNHFMYKSVESQIDAIKSGINEAIAIENLRCFTPEELQEALAGSQRDDEWQAEKILENVKCGHGYSENSIQVKHMAKLMSEFTIEERRQFLSFVTGSPRLPPGGFAALNPKMTIVLKSVPSGQSPDSLLPSCSTCQVYIKLPAYSCFSVLEEKVKFAISEGQNHFALD